MKYGDWNSSYVNVYLESRIYMKMNIQSWGNRSSRFVGFVFVIPKIELIPIQIQALKRAVVFKAGILNQNNNENLVGGFNPSEKY